MSTHTEELPSLVERAVAWEGDLGELLELGFDIGVAFDAMANNAAASEDDEYEVRKACDELLLHGNKLPYLYTAQFLVYMAATEAEGDSDAMRSRLKEAQSAIWRLEEIVKAGVGYDQRVDDLSFCIQRSLEDVNRIDPEVPFGKSLIDTEFGKPLANTKRDLNKEQKFMRIAEAKQYAAELMATGDAEDQRRLAAEGFLPGKISGQEQANQTITDHGHHLRGNGKAPIQAQGMSSTDNGAVTSPGSETLPANGAARNGAKNGAHKVFGTIADDNGPWPAGAVQSGSTASSPTKKTSPRSSTPSSMRLKSFNENFLSPTLTMVKRASRRGGLSGLFARPTEAETESGEQRVPEQAVEDEEIPRGGAVGGAM